ncbi:MAG TPA: lysophospholipid acyltransferase family protein [Methylomirabilota bacterium]|nr:lysophospholipid acyltransferase family protein [Methylomirabilota bacterium]
MAIAGSKPPAAGSPPARHPLGSPAYRGVRGLIRLLLWLFYRRIDVVGRERIPETGPVIVAANHHNALVDAMLIMATIPRPITVLAKAPLFRHPLIGPPLWMIGAVPVHRRAESGDDPRRNDEMFAAAIEALRAGGVILIFPEGRSQPQPILMPLRTGAARLLLGTERAAGGAARVTLLPIGMVFHDPGTFRSAAVQLTIGTPVATADLVTGHRDQPEEAVRAITARLTEAITARIVEAEDQYSLELLRVLERAWLEEAARRGEREPAGDAAEQALAWKQRVMRAGRYLGAREPHRIAELRHRIEVYRSHLDEVGITSEQLGQPYTVGLVVSYVARNALWLALGLPLALWGIVSHAAPYWLTGQIVKRLGRTEEEEATYKMAVGVVIYPVLWALEGWLISRSAGRGTLIVFLLLIVPSGLLALLWRERLGRFIRQARAFVWFLADRDLHRRLLDERRALVAELSELADRVPPELLRSDRASDVG